ncbi:hypothetical protein Caka_0050 [Coraliomargarita akajimensis DSM 45221]|uniref:Uncharacterized protein n=1 Tax=Coraliomargarita akajimensis (strain DSM 45221 / IAM 15411 / JCM 23193 / KCTC 12865 / 04OKA010-24) TaxID=583355 RepID=D5EKX7_CORAD|nr:hypothetical protein Caka_0050 [Coraliomargarita akajimensis DSM 45221]
MQPINDFGLIGVQAQKMDRFHFRVKPCTPATNECLKDVAASVRRGVCWLLGELSVVV